VGHAVVHFEAGAADDATLVQFYGQLFGWELRAVSGGGYTAIDTRGGGGINGAIRGNLNGGPWPTLFIDTDDVRATLDRANSLGATIVVPVTDLGEALTAAVFGDPDGLLIGLVQGSTPGPSAGSGEAVDWFEIMGSDAVRTQQFYADLFGWKVDSSAFPGYAVVDTGTGRGIWGGIGGGAGFPWAMVYAGVSDVDRILRGVESRGGLRVPAPDVFALKTAARTALYGSADDISTEVFRDPAGNLFGIYHKQAR
jgi:uncharacterized protein